MVYNILMKKLCLSRDNTKRGVASLYVVLFATILFGVITLSFMRIILSEAGQSSDDDLSQSAYDSAMAGVEDAKRAVNEYYACLSSGLSASACGADKIFAKDCDNGIGLAKYFYGDNYGSNESGWEVKIQENSVGSEVDNASDQAYTCVVISDQVPDYRGTLTADTRTRVIPLSVFNGEHSTNLTNLNRVRFQWYSRLNEGSTSNFSLSNGGKFSSDRTTPPTIQLTFIHLPGNIASVDFASANNTADYQYSTLILLPTNQNNSSSIINTVSWSTLLEAGNVTKSSPDRNEPVQVTCSAAAEFACAVELQTGSFGSQDSIFLVASLPYGDTMTDFAAEMVDSNGETIKLVGSQISVDSTGRTSQLVRRVETRLDPADLYFPYPQYALDAGGGDGDALKKIFWITANCWYSYKLTGTYQGGACQNNGNN